MITYRDIEIAFGDTVAVPQLNLTIEEGEFFTLLGPSGCGKTTALRALAGFIEPRSGEILIDGKQVTRLAPDKREVGMVFQNYALFPSMTVRENIAFGLKVQRLRSAEVDRRVAEIAQAVDLTDEQLGKSVAALSGGQQQRVAIARALVLRPKILLLDEPLSNLDAKLRGQLMDLQAQFGITTVYVTHDQEEALTLSDRIAVMNGGRIEQVGTPEQIYTTPETEFVCTFIGEVNRLSPGLVRELRARGATGLDPDRNAYLRIERLALSGHDDPVGGIPLPARVHSRTFHGLYTSYRVGLGDDTLRVVAGRERHATYEPGEMIRVGIDPGAVLQFGARS